VSPKLQNPGSFDPGLFLCLDGGADCPGYYQDFNLVLQLAL